MAPEPQDPDSTDLVAVVAHSLLGPVWSCELAAKTLIQRHDELSADLRTELLHHIVARSHFTSEMLRDLIQRGGAAVIEALEELGMAPASAD